MTWEGDLRTQILEHFRDAQRRRGEIDTSEEVPRVVLSAPTADLVEKRATGRRRLVGRTS